MVAPFTVVCMLWDGEPADRRTTYTARHVNALRGMVAERLPTPHRFVCLTDRATGPGRGFAPDVEVVECLSAYDWPKRYRKLVLFSPMARRLVGERFLFLDLDVLLVDDLAPLVDRPEDFVIWRDPGRNATYNTSVMLMSAGARPAVWGSFDVRMADRATRRLTGSDQAWVTLVLGEEATWGPENGVLSCKWECPEGPPDHARILVFHGKPKPWGRDAPAWARELWQRYEPAGVA